MRGELTMMEEQEELMVEVDVAVYKNNILKIRPEEGPERQSTRMISIDKFSQVELHEGGAEADEADQGGADGQAEEAVGECADEASLCILQKTTINDKNNLRSDYLAQDMNFTRLDVVKQQVREPVDQVQLQEGAKAKYREVQENIVSREHRYNCIDINAVQDQGDETGGDQVRGQPGGAHSAWEGAAGGHHGEQQGVPDTGGVDDEPVGAHVIGGGHECSHNPDGGPGGLSEEGAGEGGDDQEHGHEVHHGGVHREGQLGEVDGEQQQDDSLVKRRKKRARKQLLGVEPGLVQLKISQFILKFPNLKKGGPMVRLNFDGESVSTETKRELQSKRKCDQVEGPETQHTMRIRRHLTGTPR